MNYKVPGLSSIVLMFIALGIIVYQLIVLSPLIGVIYALCIPMAFLFTLYHYCRKCPHVSNKTCRHVVFGWIISKLFRPIQPSKYALKEIFLALTPLALLVLLPQFWLFRSKSLFIAFWILMLIAVIIVRIGVCRRCGNFNCALCPNADKCNVSG